MRTSYGGLGYSDIINMNINDIFEYQAELSKLIEQENKANKAGK